MVVVWGRGEVVVAVVGRKKDRRRPRLGSAVRVVVEIVMVMVAVQGLFI